MRRVGRGLARLWLIPLVVLCWEAVTRLANDAYFPPPSQITVEAYSSIGL